MKKILLSIVLLLGILVQSNAQNTFAPVGAEWWYQGHDGIFNLENFIQKHCTVMSDTIIQNKTVSKVQQQSTYMYKDYFDDGFHWSNPTVSTIEFYLYSTADTIYVMDSSLLNFLPLYVFNINEGDTVCLPSFNGGNPNPYANGAVEFCYVLDSIRNVNYDGDMLPTYFTRSVHDATTGNNGGMGMYYFNYPVYNWSFSEPHSVGAYTKQFGGVMGGLLPIEQYYYYADGPNAQGHVQLKCYADTSTSIDLDPDEDCNYLPSNESSLEESQLLKYFSIYPNPANEAIHIEVKNLNQDVHITLYDMQGRSMKQLPVTNGSNTITLNTDDITAGVYWLNIQTSRGHYTKKITIIH